MCAADRSGNKVGGAYLSIASKFSFSFRQKKVSPSREIEICNSNETTPNTAENITNHTPSRRSDRKKPDVSYYEGPETPTKARTCPFLYLTIPVDGWVVNVGQVVDTRYGFGVVSEGICLLIEKSESHL